MTANTANLALPYMEGGDFLGDVGAGMQALAEALDGILGGAWTAYTPALSGSATNPNLGTTGASTGAYKQIGRLVLWRAKFTTGGTGIAAGSGNYGTTLPVTPAAGVSEFAIGNWWAYIGSTTTGFYAGTCRWSGTCLFTGNSGNANQLGASYPAGGLSGSGQFLAASGAYEAAA